MGLHRRSRSLISNWPRSSWVTNWYRLNSTECRCTDILKKARQRMYFLRSLKSFRVHQSILVNFYRAIIESILTRSITVWFGSATQRDIDKLKSVIRNAEKIIGTGLPSLHSIYISRTEKRTCAIMKESSHPASHLFQFLPSKRRLRTFYGNKRFTNSFYPSAVRIFNNKWSYFSFLSFFNCFYLHYTFIPSFFFLYWALQQNKLYCMFDMLYLNKYILFYIFYIFYPIQFLWNFHYIFWGQARWRFVIRKHSCHLLSYQHFMELYKP